MKQTMFWGYVAPGLTRWKLLYVYLQKCCPIPVTYFKMSIGFPVLKRGCKSPQFPLLKRSITSNHSIAFISAVFVDSFHSPDCFYLLTEIMFVHGKLHCYLTRKSPAYPIKTRHWDCFIGFMSTAVQSQSRSAKPIYLPVYLQRFLHHSPCPCPGSCFPPNEQSL